MNIRKLKVMVDSDVKEMRSDKEIIKALKKKISALWPWFTNGTALEGRGLQVG